MQPLIPSNGDATLEGLSQLAHIAVSGDLEEYNNSHVPITTNLQIKLNVNMPITTQDDLNIRFKGACMEKALQPGLKGRLTPRL